MTSVKYQATDKNENYFVFSQFCYTFSQTVAPIERRRTRKVG